MISPGMNGLRQAALSPVTSFCALLYQYSSTFNSETGEGDRFLILRTVTMSSPIFFAETSMNSTSAVPFSGLMNFAGAAGAGVVLAGAGAAALIAGACAGLA